MIIKLSVGPLAEAVTQDDDACSGLELQIQFDMSVTEDIEVAMVV